MSDSQHKGQPQDPNQQQGKSTYPMDWNSVQPKSGVPTFEWTN